MGNSMQPMSWDCCKQRITVKPLEAEERADSLAAFRGIDQVWSKVSSLKKNEISVIPSLGPIHPQLLQP